MVVALLLVSAVSGTRPIDGLYDGPTPQLACDAQSLPETAAQGRVPKADVDGGRAARGYTCNTQFVGRFGPSGGYQVQRYTDRSGHDCAYYDTALIFPARAATNGAEGQGVYVMDMTDPNVPRHTATLTTPAMLSPHESLRVNARRGLLAADMGYPTFNPGWVDVYDISQDCRAPVLDSSTPFGILGHESAFSPDGTIFYVSSAGGGTLAGVDLTDPKLPSLLWVNASYHPHGMSTSLDGNRLYMADTGLPGLTILDVSQVQKHIANPTVKQLSRLSWPSVSIPQNAIPFTEHGHPYLAEVDEYTNTTLNPGPGTAAGGGYDATALVGAARIIDIQDENNPRVISNLRLSVDQTRSRAGDQQNDYGAKNSTQGYAAHYCAVPTPVDPPYVACSFIMSGLRVFSLRNPTQPVEIAYFNAPSNAFNGANTGNFAMSSPAFVPSRNEIWYSDANWGLFVVRLTSGAFSRQSPHQPH